MVIPTNRELHAQNGRAMNGISIAFLVQSVDLFTRLMDHGDCHDFVD